jgi:DNA primase
MTAQDIQEYIIINDKLEYILQELGCHHIKAHDNNRYLTCAFPNGDNKKGMSILTESLVIDSYTRNIKDKYGHSNLFTLVCFIKDLYFPFALKWLCEVLGLDFYQEEQEEIPQSLQLTRMLLDMSEGIDCTDEKEYIKPISEQILTYYYPYLSKLFKKDGISYSTQKEFEVGYDLSTNRFTIPIRDELSTLVGVKGRYVLKDCPSGEDKYIYLEPCAKSKLLYGLYKTISYIREAGFVIVVESEKNVMLLWEYGIRNVVAIGGHILSKVQVEKITRLGINEVVLCYDEDVNRLENGKIDKKRYMEEAKLFIPQITVSAMVDINGDILNKKQSPSDDINIFNKMLLERKVLQNGKES